MGVYFIALVLYVCFTDTNAAKYCSNLPSGFGRLRNGIDITKLDLLPFDVTGDNGFRMPLIDFTCDQGKVKIINGKRFDIPDQIISIDNIPSGWLDARVNIYKTSKDITKTMSANADVSVLGGLFSAGGSYKSMQHSITNSSKYIEDVKAYVSAVKVNIYPFWSLQITGPADIYIKKYLTKPLDKNNVASYKQFVKYFGTHFMEHGKYGGLIRLVLETSQSYYKLHTTKEVQAQAKGSFMKIISAGGGGGGSTQKIDTKFTEASSKTLRYYGGDTNLLAKDNGIPVWQPTVAENPWLFGGRLTPIYNFINDDKIKQSMKRAAEIHIDIAYLHELQRILFSVKAQQSLQAEIGVLNSKIEQLTKDAMPSHQSVVSLAEKIETNLNVPAWFTEKIQLCYRWYPEADVGVCGGGTKRLLCAQTGEMTQYYQDNTGRKFLFVGIGCRMSWGIINQAVTPSWFQEVKICFKWWADGDGGQCGVGSSGSICAKVGEYTSYYRDSTDSRNGGCKMQWMLSVPNTAPLWMKNAKLCFEWYPDGDGGQCGGASRSLCAYANQYTSPYKDDTDGRSGGCRMRWGIKL